MHTQRVKASFGHYIKSWRQRKRMSQLDLANEADISSRHLSFLETGRANPSREMVLRLTSRLDVPLRERNEFLTSAGYAPMYRQAAIDDPSMTGALKTVQLILKSQEPFPALAIDRHWNLILANKMLTPFLSGVDTSLLKPPINLLRLSLHPKGLVSKIINLIQWREHLFHRLEQQIRQTSDPVLSALLTELQEYPLPKDLKNIKLEGELEGLAIPFRFETSAGVLNLISATTVFGTPENVALQELAIEAFYPMDEFTMQVLQSMA